MTIARDNAPGNAVGTTAVDFVNSRPKPNPLISLFVWLLPNSGLKTKILRRLGNHIGENASLGPSLVFNCGPFWIGDSAVICFGNVFRNLRHARLGKNTGIGNFNYITASTAYQKFSDYVGYFIVEEMAGVTNRHYIDCGGQVILRRNSGVGGIKSILQSHEIDVMKNESHPGQVILEENAMTGTGCILLKGARLPEKSVLAAGSVLTKAPRGAEMPTHGLYAGAPARHVRELKDFKWWDREVFYCEETPFDDTKFKDELTKPREIE